VEVGLRRDWDPELYVRTKTSGTLTSSRIWVGLFSADPSGAGTGLTNIAGFRYDTSVSDTIWQFCTADGTTQACTSTGVTVTASTVYDFAVICSISATDCKGYINGTLVATRTANLPVSTTTMGYHFGISTLTGGTRAMLFSRMTLLHK